MGNGFISLQIQKLLISAQDQSLRAQLLRGGVGSIVLKVAYFILSFLMSAALARTLGADGYGVYALAMAVVTFLSIPAQVGIPEAVVRETARAATKEDWGRMRGLWRWGTQSVVAFSSAVFLGGLGVLYLFSNSIEPNQKTTLVIAFLLIPFIALGNLRGAALRGLRRVVLGQFPEAVIRPGLLFIAVVAISSVAPDVLTPPVAMAVNVVVVASAFALGAWLLYRARPYGIRARPEVVMDQVYWWRAAVPLALTGGIQILNSQADILILGAFRPAAEVGIYRGVAQVASIVLFTQMAIGPMLAPYFAQLHTSGQKDRLQRIVVVGIRVICATALIPATLFLVAGAEILAVVFTADFALGGVALSALVLGQLGSAILGPTIYLLNMTGHERATLRGLVAAAVANVILNFVLIPTYGMNGAAVATTVTIIFWKVLLYRAALTKIQIRCHPFVKLSK